MKRCKYCNDVCNGIQCMSCFKKSQIFNVGEFSFKNKTTLNNVIKSKIKNAPRNIEFSDKLLIDLINNLHSDVLKRNLNVTKLKILDWNGQVGEWEFCRDRFRGGIFVIGFFEPIGMWHGVTLYPHRRTGNASSSLKLTLRQKWAEHTKKRDSKDFCEVCGGLHPQLHHDNISFNEIAEKCMSLFSVKELAEGIGDDWWLHENESDAISNNHPAVKKMLELHLEVNYKWLCRICHQNYHGHRI